MGPFPIFVLTSWIWIYKQILPYFTDVCDWIVALVPQTQSNFDIG